MMASEELTEEPDETMSEELPEEPGETVSEELTEEPDSMASEESTEEPDGTTPADAVKMPAAVPPAQVSDDVLQRLFGILFPGSEADQTDDDDRTLAERLKDAEKVVNEAVGSVIGQLFSDDGEIRRRGSVPVCPTLIPRDVPRELLVAFFPVPRETQCGKAVLATAPGPSGMALNGRVVPVHPGAARLFEEIGLTE